LRWLIIGHVPDFVREHAIQYKHDVVSQSSIGVEAWTACIRSAFISAGDESRYDEGTARAIFLFSEKKSKWPDLADPILRLNAMALGAIDAVDVMRNR
jgi:hypothetical protein